MKSFTKIIAFSVIFLFSSSLYAQFDLGEKLKKRLEKEADQATDKAIDETVEGIKNGGENEKKEEKKTNAKTAKESISETEVSTPEETVSEVTSAQISFEGKVIFNVEENGEQQVIEYYSKDNKYLMEMPDKGGSVLFDSRKFKMYVLMHKDKVYMETNMMPMNARKARRLKKTGETKDILGYECEKFIFQDRNGEAWMTKELGAFMFFTGSQEMPEWQRELLDAGYFPLYVKEYDENGNLESVFDVKEVTPMELSADMFVIPSSYKKLNLMGGFEFDQLLGQ